MNSKPKQLDLFIPEEKPSKRLVYADLNIHQKINFKANQCGLHVVLRSRYHYFFNPLFRPEIDGLTAKYHWHHRKNSGFENVINFKKRQLSLF